MGLLETARRSPELADFIDLKGTKPPIRLSMFGSDQGERIEDPALIALVEERLIEAVWKHIEEDVSDAEFRKWMWGDFANIVRQLAKRKVKQGGSVSPNQVRFVLIDLLWRSFGYVSDCVRLQMQAVRLAINPGLSEQERRVFGLWYDAQPWVAGLAPIVLHNQFGLLLPTWADLETPDTDVDQTWRAFLYAMHSSSGMTENRRRADVIQKRRKHFARSNSNQDGYHASTDIEPMDRRDAGSEFQRIAEELIEIANVQCDCAVESEWDAHLNEGSESTVEIVMQAMCRRCDRGHVLHVPREEFVQVARRVRGLDQ